MHALQRAITSTSTLLDEYRLPNKNIALRIFSENCAACEKFEERRQKFESELSSDMVFDVCTDDASNRRMALRAGVRQIPSYIVLNDSQTRYTDTLRPL